MVTTILFDHIHIKEPQELLKTQHRLIENIVMGRLRAPNVKKLVGFTYHGEDVYRARINDVDRLIYTYIDYQGQRTLLLLVVQTNHNYNQTKRLLDGINPQMVPIDLKDREADESSLELKHDLDSESTEGSELALVPAYPYKHQYLVLDEEQDRAMKLHAPILLSGPPGSGKTAVLYNILLNALPGLAEQVRTLGITDGEVLFISQSQPLIQTLNDAYIHDAPETPFAVGFTTWNTLLQQHYPDSRLVTSDDFALWLSQQKHEEPVEQLHYELSIIAGLGPDEYLRLGQRQSYCAGNQKRQKELIVFLSLWEHHLQEQGGIDPMTTKLPRSANPRYLTVYCDETQNLPPVALLYLMAQAQQRQFIACLDSEQCLLSSPFILSIIKKMMYLVYQLQDREFLLPRTWRCPPIVAKVANHLMDSKHRLHKESDEALRRPYREIISARNLAEKGLVSLFNDKNAARLHELASSPKTVIIVEQLTPAIREAINTCLNSNNILTAKMAIGLDFKNVILWHPIQETSLIALAKGKKVTGLSLAQLNTFNALYVAITRAEANVLIIEDYDRFQPLIQAIFGHELAKNQLPIDLENLSPEQQRQEWLKQVEFHLSQDRLDLARSIMGFHLTMNKAQIDEFCKDRKRAMEPQRLPKAVEVSAAPAAPISKRQKPHPNPKKPMLDSKAPAPALAPKAKRASPEELKAKIAAYISNLLQNLSRIAETADSPAQEALLKEQTSNLRSLINHPRSEEFLFEPFLVDGSLLFVHLLTFNK